MKEFLGNIALSLVRALLSLMLLWAGIAAAGLALS